MRQKVLLVDDEQQILVALEDLLSDQFTVLKTTCAEDALVLMEQDHDIAVVLVDQRMPQMQGDEFVAQISNTHSAQRIMVTGYADLSAVVRAVNDGRIFAYVTKPWNGADLRAKVALATEQFRLGRELADEKKLLDDLLNHSPDGIYFKDRSLRFLRANKVAAGWLGQHVDDLVGNRLTDFIPVISDAAEIEQEEIRGLQNGTEILSTVRHIESENGGRWISDKKAPIRDDSGEILGLVGIARDITEQRALQEQLLQSQKMEAVGRLAGGVAHDFNNLLVVIQSYGDLVLEGLDETSKSHSDMVELLAAAGRATALTRQLLTFSRRKPVVAVTVDLNQVVIEGEKMISRLVDARIDVRTELLVGRSTIRGDVTQIQQVLLNLAINARDAMPDGGEIVITTAQVRVALQKGLAESDYVCFSVRDTGMGMDPELIKNILNPSSRRKRLEKEPGWVFPLSTGLSHNGGGKFASKVRWGWVPASTSSFPLRIKRKTRFSRLDHHRLRHPLGRRRYSS